MGGRKSRVGSVAVLGIRGGRPLWLYKFYLCMSVSNSGTFISSVVGLLWEVYVCFTCQTPGIGENSLTFILLPWE